MDEPEKVSFIHRKEIEITNETEKLYSSLFRKIEILE